MPLRVEAHREYRGVHAQRRDPEPRLAQRRRGFVHGVPTWRVPHFREHPGNQRLRLEHRRRCRCRLGRRVRRRARRRARGRLGNRGRRRRGRHWRRHPPFARDRDHEGEATRREDSECDEDARRSYLHRCPSPAPSASPGAGGRGASAAAAVEDAQTGRRSRAPAPPRLLRPARR
ncbi:MAG: hypothetical protein GEU80_08940 [Dehalococcoidia bacterium]|nr:hypothetical protein [Dehalococcoidia bacterium]